MLSKEFLQRVGEIEIQMRVLKDSATPDAAMAACAVADLCRAVREEATRHLQFDVETIKGQNNAVK